LLATVAALMLVLAAQASAAGFARVNIVGTGSGEVSSVGGGGTFNPEYAGEWEGEPPIECSYASPGPATGVCEDEMTFSETLGLEGTFLTATADPGSEVVGWVINEGPRLSFCETAEEWETAESFEKENETVRYCLAAEFLGGNFEATVTINKAVPKGPTNKRALTLTKSGTGAGAVKGTPTGISCGNTCSSAEASLYKETTVVLTAKAAATAGSNLEGWEGCDSSTNTGLEGTCTVKMTEARNVVAKFGGTQKAILNPLALTLSKVDNGFETGFGTVKATGLACEADCTTTTALYTSGATEPKVKPAAVVTLAATAAAGSTFTGWSGCDTETEGKCVVTMSSAKSVEAEFTALPKNALTLTKVGYGAIKSKPKGVACGNTCSSATASLPSDTTIVLSAKAGTGSSLTGWEGCDSSTNTGLEGTCTVAMSSAKAVTATFSAAIKPLINPQALTLTKAGSGYGTVKATGLACEAACTTTSVNYYGGVTEPKPKPAAVVTLTAISAPGSGTVAWSGCDSETEGKCVVSMSAAKEVTATFNELE
jgi:hypothetical protein